MPATAPYADIAPTILRWYRENARLLPWRVPPGDNRRPDPYAVWLSEIMLQQTTVAAVIPYYQRFLARWPRVQDLAAADDGDVMAAWAGLGYYARARNMLATARIIAGHGGEWPADEAGLRALPGVGPYTAAAIAAIAYGARTVVIDGNIVRVIARLFAITALPPARDNAIRAVLTDITPPQAGDFAQGLMDFAQAICTAKSPKCAQCPVSAVCLGQDIADRLPARAAKAAKPQKTGVAWWIEREGRVLLTRRPDKGLLGGMRALPGSAWIDINAADNQPASPAPAVIRHSFTHFDLTLQVVARRWDDVRGDPGIVQALAEGTATWVAIDALATAGLPTLYAKAVAAYQASARLL